MNDMKVTLKGWVASDPVKNVSKNGINYANFRIATTPRYKTSKGEWEDGKTEWITVCVFKEPFLTNITESIKKGDPVIAVGSIYTNDFTKTDGTVYKNLELRLDTIGHDLLLGISKFSRTSKIFEIEDTSNNEIENNLIDESNDAESNANNDSKNISVKNKKNKKIVA